MAFVLALILISAALQSTEASRPLATITLGNPASTDAQKIAISMVGGEIPANEQVWSERSWQAVRESSRGTEQITSDTCPALKGLAAEFRALPPIMPAPDAAFSRDTPWPSNSVMVGGFRTTVSFKVVGGSDITVSGVDAYASWGSKAANELIPCWKTPFP